MIRGDGGGDNDDLNSMFPICAALRRAEQLFKDVYF